MHFRIGDQMLGGLVVGTARRFVCPGALAMPSTRPPREK